MCVGTSGASRRFGLARHLRPRKNDRMSATASTMRETAIKTHSAAVDAKG